MSFSLSCRAVRFGCFAAFLTFSSLASGAPPLDLSRMVVVGDSLSAGFQNYSLYDTAIPGTSINAPPGGQTFGFAAQVAKQAGVDLHLPLISYPGIPPALYLGSKGELERGTTIGSREPQTLTTQTRNLSVPGFLAKDVLLYKVSASSLTNPSAANIEDLLAAEVLGYPYLLNPTNLSASCGLFPLPTGDVYLSQTECAAKLKPSVVLASVGNNDALQAVVDGVAPTKVSDFAAAYTVMLGSLRLTGARIVVSNIPDVTALPILLPVSVFTVECGFTPAGVTSAGDFVVPYLANPNPSSFSICANYAVRSASLIAQAKKAVQQYNQIINDTACLFSATVVDVNGTLNNIALHGYNVNGHHLTTQYLGGIFSLDGVHPTNTGYAILANAYIDAMNKSLRTNITPVNISAVAKGDPLIF